MSQRETFSSRLGLLATMVGLAVGLGNVWRFPYMVGQFGGAAFILLYVGIAGLIGVPALMGEWSLGRHTRRGTLGAYERVGVPGGRGVAWLLIGIVWFAVAYYTNAIGWVVYHALAELLAPLGRPIDPSRILPPETGFSGQAFGLQLSFTALVLLAEAAIILRGVRAGIETASKIITPVLFAVLLIVIVRSVTLPGASEGIRWLLAFDAASITPTVAIAALGQVVFSIGLGGTLMLVYGSYLGGDANIRSDAIWTVLGDTGAGLLAGLAIFPAVFAFGMEPGSGPGLLFATLPQIFAQLPAGWVFGALFFGGLSGAALLSGIAAYEVIVAGFTDTFGWSRRRATWTVYGVSMLLAMPPMINLEIFVPWDLTFGSGGQTFGALVAVVTVGWVMRRATLLEQIAGEAPSRTDRALIHWLRWVVPTAVMAAALWWLLTDVLGAAQGV
ncbi:MAG TPA: sodium-dependent transporter [Gemmatimonadetes bacterium]|nr:sodium-dependent transporter [Gemmatimonadota bacterium]HIN52515.1 sodium-dependent transporter [Gemmatimonadota bacterium]